MKNSRAFAGFGGERGARRRLRLAFLVVLASVAAVLAGRVFGPPMPIVYAQPSPSPILPERFQTTWDPGIPNGIPSDSEPERGAAIWVPTGDPFGGYSVNPTLTGTTNAATFTRDFQAAIAAAGTAAVEAAMNPPSPTNPIRRIVKLKAGTYYVNPQPFPGGGQVGIYVNVDNVTIRGEGPSTTRIAAAGAIPNLGTVILFGHRTATSDAAYHIQGLTVPAPKGGNTLWVGNAANYAVGDIITIDRLDGPAVLAPAATPPPGVAGLGAGPAMINGGSIWFYDAKYFKRQPTRDWNGPGTGAPAIGAIRRLSNANSYATSAVPSWRSRMQTTEIMAILGNRLTLRDPLHLDFPAGDSQVWLTVPVSDARNLRFGNRWSGIEDIAVAGGNNDWGFPGGSIAFSYMAYGWAKNVEADGDKVTGDRSRPGKLGYNIGVGRSYRVVVRDSYVHGSATITPGGHAYGIVVGVGSSACLVENNISVNNNKPITLNSSGGGNVIAYNYVDRAIIWGRNGTANGWQENGIDDSHGSFTHHDLIEGNWTPNLGADTTHGNSAWHTHLRNYAHGTNSLGGPMTSNRRAVGMDGWTHDHAYVGNILMGGAVYETTPWAKTGVPVYQLGNNYAGIGGNWDNGYAWAHIYRNGNRDNVEGLVWTEQCATAACAIPNSLYLAEAPPFFASAGCTWPWIEPVTGTVRTLPAKDRFEDGVASCLDDN